MLIDLSLKITKKYNKNASENNINILNNEKLVTFGHLGTHFDVMDKEFPLEYTNRKAVVFDVSHIVDRDINISDIDINLVKENMFVAFYTGYIERKEYGTKDYFTLHPQLSDELITELVNRKISIIGIDFAGVRRGAEHIAKDQYCADRGVFVIENLCNLGEVLNKEKSKEFIANTYPLNLADMTGLPCRVVADVK